MLLGLFCCASIVICTKWNFSLFPKQIRLYNMRNEVQQYTEKQSNTTHKINFYILIFIVTQNSNKIYDTQSQKLLCITMFIQWIPDSLFGRRICWGWCDNNFRHIFTITSILMLCLKFGGCLQGLLRILCNGFYLFLIFIFMENRNPKYLNCSV